jgi:hypothetical protein
VAGDLRAVVGPIQIVADVDRMGALALHVAKIARRRHPRHAVPEEVNGYFAEMGRVAVELGNSARELLLSRDPSPAALHHRLEALTSMKPVPGAGRQWVITVLVVVLLLAALFGFSYYKSTGH